MSTIENTDDTEKKGSPYPLHAVQMVELRVTELNLSANLNVDRTKSAGAFNLSTGHGPYDSENKRIQVKVSARIGSEETEAPFSLFVELVAVFTVDETRFPVEHIAQWAQTNAPLVVYPYVREHAYALAVRAGFPPLILPLLEIPTFRLMPSANGEMQVITKRPN